MRALFLSALLLGAIGVVPAAEARSLTCAEAIRRVDAGPLQSRAAIEQIGRAKMALSEGRLRECAAHVQQARVDEARYERRFAYSGSSIPPQYARPVYRSETDELNRRELERYYGGR
jgi:hypothetical protein